MAIYYQSQNDFQLSPDDEKRRGDWIVSVIEEAENHCGEITYIFCSDEQLLEINQQYLKHDTYTDIITFDYSQDDLISGDIFISTDRVRENAEAFDVSFDMELSRVMVHGVLHLLGHSDHSEEEKKAMRAEEDRHLAVFHG
ncbi:rRNA maturation RNase YbeY [Cryomorphaceae bacterium]|nr:rRNA maturation RNase YbeY [Cryomorphaceae bacterium]